MPAAVSPEVRPPEARPPAEKPSFESRFQQIGGQFRTIQTRFLATVAGLARDNPTVNLTGEEEDLRSQANALERLGEDTEKRLGIDVRGVVGAAGAKVRGGIDTLASRAGTKLEVMRREDLFRHFQEEGLEDPQKALAVVDYLEHNLLHTRDWVKVRGKDEIQIEQPYRYSKEDVESIRQITSGVEDPIKLLNQISQVIQLPQSYRLHTFSRYVELVKDNPRLPDLIARLSQIGSLGKISIYNVNFSDDEQTKATYRDYYSNKTLPEPIQQFLKIPQEEYEKLFSQDNINWVKQLNERLVNFCKRREADTKSVVRTPALQDLLTIAGDATFQKMYEESIRDRFGEYSITERNVGESADFFLGLVREAPELIELYKNGFNVGNIIKYNYSFEQGLSTAIARRGEFQQILADGELCKRAQIMERYGRRVPVVSSLENAPTYLQVEPEQLEKSLVILNNLQKTAADIEGDVHNELQSICRLIKNGALDKVGVEEVKTAFEVLNEHGVSYTALPVHLGILIGDCQDGHDLQNRMEWIVRPDFQESLAKFFTSYALNNPDIRIEALKSPELFSWLYENRERMHQRIELWQEKNKYFDSGLKNLSALKQLADLSDAQFEQLTSLLADRVVISDSSILRGIRLLSFSQQEREELFASCERHYMPIISDGSTMPLNNEAAEILLSASVQRREELFAIADKLPKPAYANYGLPSEKVLFWNYLLDNPQALDRLTVFAGLNEAAEITRHGLMTGLFMRLIDKNRENPEFILNDYITEQGLPTLRFITDLIEQREAYHYDENYRNGVLGLNDVLTVLLSDDFLASLSPQEKPFWQAFKIVPLTGRAILVQQKERFNEFFADGKPTVVFLNEFVLKEQTPEKVDRLLSIVDFESFSQDERIFWQVFRITPYPARPILTEQRERLNEFFINGKPTASFLEEVVGKQQLQALDTLLEIADLESYPQDEKAFWQSYRSFPRAIKKFVLEQKDRFSELVVDGKETPAFYSELAVNNPQYFVENADRAQWKMAFGEDIVNKFLDSLPRQTDEKRNAFTHNEYDRTTEFIKFLLYQAETDFGVNTGDLEVLTSYVSQFGLARSPLMFHYFKNIYLFEQQKISELPQDIEVLGIRSVQEMKTQLARVREIVYGETPLTDLSQFSNFEVQMLSVITGKSTHRFDYSKQPIERIMQDFQQDIASGSIVGLPQGYRPEVLDAANVRIEFNAEEVRDDYETLRAEILASIQNPNDVETLSGELKGVIQRKIEEIETVVASSEGKKRDFVEKERERFLGYRTQLGDVKSLDSLTSTILDINFDKTEQRLVNSIVRRIIFSKVFQKHFSGGFIQEIQMQLEGEISAASLETVINIIDEMGKTHVFNLKGDNQEGYWDEEVFKKVRDSKRGRDLPNCFSPHINKLKEAVRNFEKIQEGGSNKIAIIPDRGFVGEMSGYLADVCYTAEYPLLKKWPNVVPYKFVMRDPDTQELRFIGSVLVFEVSDTAGNPSLLVRAFDVPQESTIDIDGFIEQFLDKMVEVGKERGKRRVLVAGAQGSISNYQMTINHMSQNYIRGREPVSLSEQFRFNNYDLTNSCFVAREIKDDDN